jgi:capsular exopolysaccharide synthesis family protein
MDTATPSESPEIKLHFLDYWRVIRLRRSLILVVFLLCVLTSTLLTLWLPKQYSSEVCIEVQKDIPVVSTGRNSTVVQSDPFWLTTQFQIIKSYSILTNVILDPTLNLRAKFAEQNGDTQPWTLDETYEYLYKNVTADQRRLTDLIEITVRNQDPKIAARIANSITESYRQSRIEQYQSTHQSGILKFEEHYSNTVAELAEKRDLAEQDRTNLNIPEIMADNPQATETIQTEQIRGYDHARIDALTEYLDVSNTVAKVSLIPREELPLALPEAIHLQDADWTTMHDRYVFAKDQFAAITNTYGPEQQEYKTRQKALVTAERDYLNKISGVMLGLSNHLETARAYYEIITNTEDEAIADFQRKSTVYRPYYEAKAEVASLQRQVEEMQRELIELEVEAGIPLNIVTVRDPGREEKRPISPKGKIIIPIGIVLGLMVGVGLAFFIEYLDTSVKTIDDIERALQAPVLGVIPQNVGNVLEDGSESPHAEAYRVLRTNLLFSRKNESWNTITVLSGGAGEGKSTTLFNLAAVFAQNGQRVLIVDSDLRRPSLHKLFHLSNAHGLTDLLLKQKSIDEVIQKTKFTNCDFLASGKLPSSSMSILGSSQMKDAIHELKRRYEFIFFDSPPLLGISDASILASEMDMVLQVVQYRRYPQPMTLRAKQMILKVGGNLIGIVLNNINMSQDESYYYYSGYYEYQSQQKEPTVVQLSDAAKEAKIEIKQKY